MRALSIWIVMAGLIGVPSTSQADGCKALMGKIKALGVARRAIRDPNTRSSRLGRLESKAARLDAWISANLASCDLIARARRSAHLAPYVALSEEDRPQAVKGLVRIELAVRTVLPEDMVCIVATRKLKAARRGAKCFTSQDQGASSANLKGFARGWCQARKAGRTSRNFGIETNKLAEMFTWAGAPSDFPERVLDHWAMITCPNTL